MYWERRSTGLEDSGGAGLKARIRWLRETPHAEARESWYATVFGDGREYVDGSSSSFNDNDPSAANASSAADARTDELSPALLVFGRFSPKSSFPDPTFAIADDAVRLGINRSPYERVVLVDFCLRGAFRDLLLLGVLAPVPVRVKSETPSSRARRGVATPLAMLDFGESRCLEADLKCEERFPPYVDDRMLWLSYVLLSGVNGDELLFCACRVRGEGVKGIRPPAVRVEKIPVWDFIGVDIAVAIAILGYDLGRKTTKCIDR